MKLELWARAEDVFHAALERAPEERRSFLDEVCGDNFELRREVEALIAGDAQAGSFLEHPLLKDAAGTTKARASLVGRQLGPYRVMSLIGAGGMGQVYRAHDDKLDRDVAIKTLAPELASDPERLARFRREARTLAALNHPHIAAIYGLEEAPESDYLVLELVEGQTLRGPFPLATALDYAVQIADALQGAHEHGIIHRDLKPANLMVTAQGTVKVLDFGLAKTIWGAEAKPELAARAAPGASGTNTGQILGTPGYMSPEQALGKALDQRTDIWAFGCVLYELLAGRRAFECGSLTETITAVLDREPDWHALPRRTPARLRELLQRCLEKDADRRLNDIAEARATLQELNRATSRRSGQRAASAGSKERRGAVMRIRALAVLPMANLTGDSDQEYFADGMTEALITELSQIRALRVISRTSVMRYKGTTKSVPEIGRDLGVDGIIEGSVTRYDNRVRITAQLIHAQTDRHLWARTYERDLRDVLALQGEVARAITDEIQVEVTPQERASLARVRPVNVESHESYIRGRYHWGRVHPERSIEHFRRAIEIDPENALAHAGIADAQCMLFGAAMELIPPPEIAPKARASALRALELDESLAEPHVSLARVLFWHDRDPVGAERELRRAIQLNPSCAMAHFHCGMLLADLRRSNEALVELQRAVQLDPVSPWNLAITGFFVCQLDQDEAGKQLLRKSIELDADFFLPWSLSAVVQCDEGNCLEAVELARKGESLAPDLPIVRGWMGYALAKAGRRSEAIAVLDELEALSHQRYVAAGARFWPLAGLGDVDRALEWMETGFRERDSQLPHIAAMRAFAPLRADPRFQDLLRRLAIVK
ncbi:MAG: protein kinase [Thermoanaerobaculia bacterium]|nr:protein kinase [Thermoanaerobaculia bacterium]